MAVNPVTFPACSTIFNLVQSCIAANPGGDLLQRSACLCTEDGVYQPGRWDDPAKTCADFIASSLHVNPNELITVATNFCVSGAPGGAGGTPATATGGQPTTTGGASAAIVSSMGASTAMATGSASSNAGATASGPGTSATSPTSSMAGTASVNSTSSKAEGPRAVTIPWQGSASLLGSLIAALALF